MYTSRTVNARVPAAYALPAEPDAFVGRERDLESLRDLLRSGRLVTLCAAGGMGKSRLALRLGLEVVDDFPDGVWLAELADVTRPDLVVTKVADLLQVPEESGRDRLDVLADALRPRRLLLLLDNCEHLLDASARLARTLLTACPDLRILATSREALQIHGESVYQVPPLTVPRDGDETPLEHEAVRLFAARATAVRPDFRITPESVDDVVALCRALDGMPLAIELAAARITALTPREIVQRLNDRFRLLTTGDRTAPARQRTLRATVDWSYEQLTPQEQTLLRRMASLSGETQIEDVEIMYSDGDLPAENILDLLTSLVNKSLVVRSQRVNGVSRYRLLETIREYGAEKLAQSGEAERMARNYRDRVITVAEAYAAHWLLFEDSTWDEWLAMLNRAVYDRGHVHFALGWSLERGEIELGMRLANAMFIVWMGRGEYTEALEWNDRLLAADSGGIAPGVRGMARIARAYLAFEPGLQSDAEARAEIEAGIALCERAGDSWGVNAGRAGLGFVALRAGDLATAERHFTEGLANARREENRMLTALHLGGLGGVALFNGRMAESGRLFDEGVALTREADFLWGAALMLSGLARLAEIRGDLDAARARLEESMPYQYEVGSQSWIARCLTALGRIAIAQGRTQEAYGHLADALRRNHSIGSRVGICDDLEQFAELATALERAEAAERLRAAAAALHHGDVSGTDAAVELALHEVRPQALVPAPAEPPAPEDPLTRREREIAELVARGLSNKAIADELFISPATAARHVANVLAKLGFNSRSQIATWVVRRTPAPH